MKSSISNLEDTLTNVVQEELGQLQKDTAAKFDALDSAAAERAAAVDASIADASAAAEAGDAALSSQVDALQQEVDNTITTKLGAVDTKLADLKEKTDKDIAANLKEIEALASRVAANDVGKNKDNALATCQHILLGNPLAADGKYFIDPNGGSKNDAFEVHCDMTNGGVVVIEPTVASKTMPHKSYKKEGGANGDKATWASKMTGHPTKKVVAYLIPASQLVPLQKAASSAAQQITMSCTGALLYRHTGESFYTDVYSSAAMFKSHTGKRWEHPRTKAGSFNEFNPYLSYTVGKDECGSNDNNKRGETEFQFATQDYAALPVADYMITDFGDPGEGHGTVYGAVRFVVPARPKAGETYNTAGKTCRHILLARPDAPDGLYFIKPAAKAFLVRCDMTCSSYNSACAVGNEFRPDQPQASGETVGTPGWTCIEPKRHIPYRNWYSGSDGYRWFSSGMNVRKGWRTQYAVADDTSMKALQAASSVAAQKVVGHCRDSIMWGYGFNFEHGYGYATQFKGYNNAVWRYNSPEEMRPMVANDEDGCRTNAQEGINRRDKTTFRFMTGLTQSLPIVDFAAKDIGGSSEMNGFTIGAVCFN